MAAEYEVRIRRPWQYLQHLTEIRQAVERSVERFVPLCKMQTDDALAALSEEGRAGHASHTNFPRHFRAEFHITVVVFHVLLKISEDKIRALWIGVGNAEIVKTRSKKPLHVRIMRTELRILAVRHLQANDRSLHQGGWCTDGVEIVVLLDLIHDALGCECIAKTPSGDGIGL